MLTISRVFISIFLAFPWILEYHAVNVEQNEVITDQVILSKIRINATFGHIGIHLDIDGDENYNSTLEIEYKPTGTSTYLPACVTRHATPDMIVSGANLNMHFHAGSAMHLMPNSPYDLRLTLEDLEGGSLVIDTCVWTRKFPCHENSDLKVYVVPGSGGGDGSVMNPYLGIQAAVDNAAPGQIIEVADGIYEEFALDSSGTELLPIIIRSTNLHGAIIDGGNTNRGVVTLGVYNDSLQHIFIDGFEIRNGKWGIDAQNTQYLTIKNNKIHNVEWGIYNRRALGWEHDQYIHNNELSGRTPWPQLNGEIPSERGIDIRGNRNVVSYNSISDFGDGITTDGEPYKVSYALDIHHNDITRIVDDLIEIDGSISNTRVYKNRAYNGRMGISVAPVFGGPAYIFRNEFYNLEYSSIKMNREPAGLIIVNNSMVKLNRGLTSNAGWRNTIFQNNAVLSSHYVMEEYGLVEGSIDDWNYNGYMSLRAGTSGQPWFKWNNVKYSNIQAINSSGITESNSIAIDTTEFKVLTMPMSYSTEALPADQDFQLTDTSALINQGTMFDNILDLDSIIANPDIGAYELNQSIPSFGHNFDLICDRTSIAARTWNGNINKGWHHPDNWTPCGVPTKVTIVTIPDSLARYPLINSNAIISDLYLLGNGKVDLTEGVELRIEN